MNPKMNKNNIFGEKCAAVQIILWNKIRQRQDLWNNFWTES